MAFKKKMTPAKPAPELKEGALLEPITEDNLNPPRLPADIDPKEVRIKVAAGLTPKQAVQVIKDQRAWDAKLAAQKKN